MRHDAAAAPAAGRAGAAAAAQGGAAEGGDEAAPTDDLLFFADKEGDTTMFGRQVTRCPMPNCLAALRLHALRCLAACRVCSALHPVLPGRQH